MTEENKSLFTNESPTPDPMGPPGRVFRTQMEGVKYLNGQGYKIGRDKFSRHVIDGFIPKLPNGGFEASALLGYAAAHCEPLASAVNREADNAALERMKADTANKQAMAERNRLKLERERGNLISRDDHETELAARAAFFRREIETFGPRLAPRIIALVGGRDESQEDFLRFWTGETEIWMDAWAQDRTFALPVGAIDETGAEPETDEEIEAEPEEDDDPLD